MKRGYQRAHQGGQSGGPLVTNHLRDLDIELELLKRKRLMIQQQQRMLSNDRYDQQPFLRNQPQYDQRQNYGESRNYSHLYDDGRQGGRPMDSQFGRSYQSVGPNWELETSNQYNQSADNRNFSSNRSTFASKMRNSKPNFAPKNKNFNQQNDKFSKTPFNNTSPFKPKFVSSNKPNKSGPTKNVRKDFNPTKVTKPKNKVTNNPPNKLGNQSIETRRNLVQKAVPLSQKQELGKDFWVLKVNEPPNAKIVGRMELALGTLLKEARENFADQYADFFNTIRYQRELKKELRIRIRSVLLGKAVPQLQDIVILYRNEFPPDTDRSLLELCKAKDALEKNKLLVKKFLPEDDPEKFFKIHFHRLFSKQMEKLYQKMIHIQEQENNKPIEDIIAELPDIFDNSDITEKADEALEKSMEGDENPTEETKKDDTPVEVKTSEQPLSEEKVIDDVALENGDVDKNEKAEDNAASDEAKQHNDASDATKDTVASDPADQDNATIIAHDDKTNEHSSNETAAKRILKREEKVKFYVGLLDELIETRLPHYILNKKDEFMDILDIDTVFKTSRAAVLIETTKKAEKLCGGLPSALSFWDSKENYKENPKPVKTEADLNKSKTTPTVRKLTHFVKVVGKPNLPDKNIMKKFIDAFNPKSIKKHKHINNLLFIGFACKADMDKILKENGTTVGDKKLIIKVSDKLYGASNEKNQNEDVPNNEIKQNEEVPNNEKKQNEDVPNNEKKQNEDVPNISSDLEEQITDLLTSVRNSAEESNCDKDGDIEMQSESTDKPINENVEAADDNVVANGTDAILADIKEEIVEDSKTTEAASKEPSKEINSSTEILKSDKVEVVKDEDVVKNDKLEAIKEEAQSGRGTPTRSSSRLTGTATPSSVRTRRASKLTHSN